MKTQTKTTQLTILGLMTAVLLLMAYTPLGYLNIGPLAITFNVIPVAICAITLGPAGGAAAGAVFAYNSENLPGADFKTHILTFHQGLHHISVDILTPLLPVAGHSLRLILVGDGEVEADED